jgi:hypothetical protein
MLTYIQLQKIAKYNDGIIFDRRHELYTIFLPPFNFNNPSDYDITLFARMRKQTQRDIDNIYQYIHVKK